MKKLVFIFTLLLCQNLVFSQGEEHSIARTWNEELLHGIRNDFARPTVHARNLWHTSVAMYDIWAVYDPVAEPFFLGNTVGGYTFEFDGIPESSTPREDMEEAISFAMYRIMFTRFLRSPGAGNTIGSITNLMIELGYNVNNQSTNYQSGDPAALGNYIAEQILEFGLQDNSNEQGQYENLFYEPVNEPMVMTRPGSGDLVNMNRWQPLTLDIFIDQSGNEIPGDTPDFLSPEWGIVTPFALKEEDLSIYNRDGFDYYVYHDPGPPPFINENEIDAMSEEYKWGFSLVSIWASHLDPSDGVMWDISPGSIGNVPELPESIAGYRDFYDYLEGGDPSLGHDINPFTGQPYEPNMVPRADYGRVLAEFWADGPDSETPPGHWFTILNYVTDHPAFERKYRGIGEPLDPLEWDVKAYFALGGAMHDCAITAWGIKGYYDYIRPVSAIRGMGDRGQSSDPNLPNYHPAGMPLVEGYIELVDEDDPLVGNNMENLNKIKLYTWRGPDFIDDPETDDAGVGWILSENWWPYQRPSFVTPPFAGFVSGHSTYSRAAAELLTVITGDEYFPGGMGEFVAPRNEFLVFEEGPSVDVVLQWATYRDASDQTSLSRIWGGIHPPADDIPGRLIGMEIAEDAVVLAEEYFFKDEDNDGYYNYVDCDDNNPMVNPGLPETCDGLDNNCSGEIDEGLAINSYFFDFDNDGFGDAMIAIDTCLSVAPAGFVANADDCNDGDSEINPDVFEVCDGIDNNCSGVIDDGLPLYTYFFDFDNDGYGDALNTIDTCLSVAPAGFVANADDCNDSMAEINPDIVEVCDGVDNNCSGEIDEGLPLFTYFFDSDNDGYGDFGVSLDTCIMNPPSGYVRNADDCNDAMAEINPDIVEVCDGIDNNCSGAADEGLPKNRYYLDFDNDGFGDESNFIDTCIMVPPAGFVVSFDDCNDDDASIYPGAQDIPDNGIDEDCSNYDLFIEAKVFPNPFSDALRFHIDTEGEVDLFVYDRMGRQVHAQSYLVANNFFVVNNLSTLSAGVYYYEIVKGTDLDELSKGTIVKL